MVDEHFVIAYRDARPEDLPWYHVEPDADLIALIDQVLPASGARVLDLGAGPAVHSIELAARGHQVVAIDGVPEARTMALALAATLAKILDGGQGITLRYARCVDLLGDLHAGLADGTYARRLKAWARPDLLIVDDVGLGQVRQRDDEPTPTSPNTPTLDPDPVVFQNSKRAFTRPFSRRN